MLVTWLHKGPSGIQWENQNEIFHSLIFHRQFAKISNKTSTTDFQNLDPVLFNVETSTKLFFAYLALKNFTHSELSDNNFHANFICRGRCISSNLRKPRPPPSQIYTSSPKQPFFPSPSINLTQTKVDIIEFNDLKINKGTCSTDSKCVAILDNICLIKMIRPHCDSNSNFEPVNLFLILSIVPCNLANITGTPNT